LDGGSIPNFDFHSLTNSFVTVLTVIDAIVLFKNETGRDQPQKNSLLEETRKILLETFVPKKIKKI
jgi:hypothetical protein